MITILVSRVEARYHSSDPSYPTLCSSIIILRIQDNHMGILVNLNKTARRAPHFFEQARINLNDICM